MWLVLSLTATAGSWPMEGHDPRRTGQSDVVGSHGIATIRALAVPQAQTFNHPPVITDGGDTVIGAWGVVRSGGSTDRHLWSKFDGALYRLHPDLTPMWPFHPPDVPYCYSWAGRSDPSFCPAGGDFNAANGTIEGTPAVAGDRLYVGRGDGRLYAVDLATGTRIWDFPTFNPLNPTDPDGGGEIVGGPVVGPDGTVYFATMAVGPYETNAIYAITPDGDLRWRHPHASATLTGVIRAPLALSPDGSRLYAAGGFGPTTDAFDATVPGQVYAFDLSAPTGTGDQRLLWTLEPHDTSVWWSPALWASRLAIAADGTLIVGGTRWELLGGRAAVWAITDHGASAAMAWPAAARVDGGGALAVQGLALHEVAGSTVEIYASSGTTPPVLNTYLDLGGLYALDPADGSPTWSAPFIPADHGMYGMVSGISIDVAGNLYAGVSGRKDHGKVVSLFPDGRLRWSAPASGLVEWGSPVLAPDGALVYADTRRCDVNWLPWEWGFCGHSATPSVYRIPHVGELTLDPVSLAAGSPFTLVARGAPPGSRVAFVVGDRAGRTTVPGCDTELAMSGGVVLGSSSANPSGIATLTRTAPASSAGTLARFVAVQAGACLTSGARDAVP